MKLLKVTSDLIIVMKKEIEENGTMKNFQALLEKYIIEAICAISLGVRYNLLRRKRYRIRGFASWGCKASPYSTVRWSVNIRLTAIIILSTLCIRHKKFELSIC